MKGFGIANELTLLTVGFVGSFEVCAVVTDNSMYCPVNELVKETTRLGESLSFLTEVDFGDNDDSARFLENELVDIDSM